MPVTKTAKRALRSSLRKKIVNSNTLTRLEIAIRKAKKTKTVASVTTAISLADRAAKKKVIHANKAARIKSQLSKLGQKKSENQKTQKTKKLRRPINQKKK